MVGDVARVLGTSLSAGINETIIGITGIGHILMGVRILLLLLQIRGSSSDVDRTSFGDEVSRNLYLAKIQLKNLRL